MLMLASVRRFVDRAAPGRAVTLLRVLLRGNEVFLVPLALVVGIVAGATRWVWLKWYAIRA